MFWRGLTVPTNDLVSSCRAISFPFMFCHSERSEESQTFDPVHLSEISPLPSVGRNDEYGSLALEMTVPGDGQRSVSTESSSLS